MPRKPVADAALIKQLLSSNSSSIGDSGGVAGNSGCSASATPVVAVTVEAHCQQRTVHIAVQGCCHGDLDLIYDACRQHELSSGKKIDFLICCGDFQAIRNAADMRSMAVPEKYKVFGDFVQYYEKKKTAPYLTLFIGGNHEASNLLAEEYYGGYVADHIYYLGHSSVVNVCGVKIAALSGIYKGHDYTRPYHTLPYTPHTMRCAYHIRSFEVEKLQLYRDCAAAAGAPAPDLLLSHDWPVGITKFGDEAGLLRVKPFFRDDIAHGALGNPHTLALMRSLRPKFWLAAHLHCHFVARVPHDAPSTSTATPTQSALPHALPHAASPPWGAPATQFIALDKCVHESRTCLTFLDMNIVAPASDTNVAASGTPQYPAVEHDGLWMEVVRHTHHLLRVEAPQQENARGSTPWENSVLRDPNMMTLVVRNWSTQRHEGMHTKSLAATSTRALLQHLRLGSNPLALTEVKGLFAVDLLTHRVPPSLVPSVSALPAAHTQKVQHALSDDSCDWIEDVGR